MFMQEISSRFYLVTVVICCLMVADTSAIGNCTLDGCSPDSYCNKTSSVCELCRNHADDCLTTRQQPQCNQLCFKLMLKQSKETKKCHAPPELGNGKYNGRRVNQPQQYGDEVIVTCNTGYHVRGQPENVCGSYGSWKNQFASCEVNTCKLMPNIANGKVKFPEDKKHLSYGDLIQYTCDKGYDIIGSNVLVCNEDGEWNASIPYCQKVSCRLPEPISNGHHNGTSIVTYGEVLQFTCMDNFRLEGNVYLTCQADGDWDREPPVCEDIECAEPPLLMNGYFKKKPDKHLVRSSVLYGCNIGYAITGHQYQLWTCQENGLWDKDTVPVCSKVKPKEFRCEVPTHPLHGRHDATKDIRPGETVEFTCEDGYKLNGDKILTCLNHGIWDNTYPTCNRTVCTKPVEIKNGGIVEKERIEFPSGTSVHYMCTKGYDLIEKEFSIWTCTNKGVWDKSRTPTCKKLEHDGCSYITTILVTVVIVLFFQLVVVVVVVRKYGLTSKCFNKAKTYHFQGENNNVNNVYNHTEIQEGAVGKESTKLLSDNRTDEKNNAQVHRDIEGVDIEKETTKPGCSTVLEN